MYISTALHLAIWRPAECDLSLVLQLPKRLARRLMDLQFLPYIVVTNPHIKRVYDSYQHAFETLHNLPQVRTVEQNAEFTTLLKRLVDEHGECYRHLHGPKLLLPRHHAILHSLCCQMSGCSRSMQSWHNHAHLHALLLPRCRKFSCLRCTFNTWAKSTHLHRNVGFLIHRAWLLIGLSMQR